MYTYKYGHIYLKTKCKFSLGSKIRNSKSVGRNFRQWVHNTCEHTHTHIPALPHPSESFSLFSTTHTQHRRWYCCLVWCSLVNVQQAGVKIAPYYFLWKADSILCNVPRHSRPGKQERRCSRAEELLEHTLKLTLTDTVCLQYTTIQLFFMPPRFVKAPQQQSSLVEWLCLIFWNLCS